MAENKVLWAPNRENMGLQGPQLNIDDNRGYRDRSVRPGDVLLEKKKQQVRVKQFDRVFTCLCRKYIKFHFKNL